MQRAELKDIAAALRLGIRLNPVMLAFLVMGGNVWLKWVGNAW
jgi:hypothetical protein